MSAFDGDNSLVSVFFDGPGADIQIALSDDPKDYLSERDEDNGVLTIDADAIPAIVSDLECAYFLRTGKQLLWVSKLA